jgi:hypothetical protein
MIVGAVGRAEGVVFAVDGVVTPGVVGFGPQTSPIASRKRPALPSNPTASSPFGQIWLAEMLKPENAVGLEACPNRSGD